MAPRKRGWLLCDKEVRFCHTLHSLISSLCAPSFLRRLTYSHIKRGTRNNHIFLSRFRKSLSWNIGQRHCLYVLQLVDTHRVKQRQRVHFVFNEPWDLDNTLWCKPRHSDERMDNSDRKSTFTIHLETCCCGNFYLAVLVVRMLDLSQENLKTALCK